MVRIDRELALAQKTDTGRWSNPDSLEAAWDGRAELAAQFIPAGARVLDLGCGKDGATPLSAFCQQLQRL
jgi:hypothetical protein